MCECLEYDDGSMYLCECCAGMWREYEQAGFNTAMKKHITELHNFLADVYQLFGALKDDCSDYGPGIWSHYSHKELVIKLDWMDRCIELGDKGKDWYQDEEEDAKL